jgi:hypothetical protein
MLERGLSLVTRLAMLEGDGPLSFGNARWSLGCRLAMIERDGSSLVVWQCLKEMAPCRLAMLKRDGTLSFGNA